MGGDPNYLQVLGAHPPSSPPSPSGSKGTCDMCGSNSEAQDGSHIHHSSHHRQDIAKDQHVPLRAFKTGLTDMCQGQSTTLIHIGNPNNGVYT